MINQKQSKIIVYMNSFRNSKILKKYGIVVYSSKADRYVVMYIDKDNFSQIENTIVDLPVVKRVVGSPLNELVMTFSRNQQDLDDDDEEI